MTKNILSILGGFITAIILIVALSALGYAIYGPEHFVGYSDKIALSMFIHSLPLKLFFFMCFGVFLGSIMGGFVASQIYFEAGESNSIIVGVMIFVSLLIYLFLMPHPIWFWFVSLMTCIPLAYLGYFIDSSYLGKEVEES